MKTIKTHVQCVQRHRKVPWDTELSAAYRCTLLIYKSKKQSAIHVLHYSGMGVLVLVRHG